MEKESGKEKCSQWVHMFRVQVGSIAHSNVMDEHVVNQRDLQASGFGTRMDENFPHPLTLGIKGPQAQRLTLPKAVVHTPKMTIHFANRLGPFIYSARRGSPRNATAPISAMSPFCKEREITNLG